jgi:hypothetical protein
MHRVVIIVCVGVMFAACSCNWYIFRTTNFSRILLLYENGTIFFIFSVFGYSIFCYHLF